MQTELRELKQSSFPLPVEYSPVLADNQAPGMPEMMPPGKPQNRGSRHRLASIVAVHVGVVAMVTALLFASGLGTQVMGAFAQSRCSRGDQTYVVVSGDTLGAIAARFHTTWPKLASYNHIANPNMIYVQQTVCIPGHTVVKNGPPPVKGQGNFFPYGECTWWAAQRYYALNHVFVPWTTQSDAWQWTARARQFHWRVSTTPRVGAIINLQPWVEGAYGLGHVAVVERVLSNGDVIASNLNWGAYYWRVVDVQFTPGPGVTFLTY